MANSVKIITVKILGIDTALTSTEELQAAFDQLNAELLAMGDTSGKAFDDMVADLERIEDAIKAAESVAKDANFVPKTLKELEDASESLRQKLAEVPRGTDKYNEILEALRPIEAQIFAIDKDLELLDPEKNTKAFVDLGDQVVSSFESATFLVQKFNGESEVTQKILSGIETAVFAVQLARNVSEAALSVKTLLRIKSTKTLNVVQAESNKLTKEGAQAANNAGDASIKAGKGGFIGGAGIKFLSGALKALGVGALITTFLGLIANLGSLKPAIDFVTDAFEGLKKGADVLFKSIGPAISSLLSGDVTKAWGQFTNGIKKGGVAATKEFNRQGQIRAFAAKEQALELAQIGQAAQDQQLAQTEAGAAELAARQQKRLAERIVLEKEKLTVVGEFTDAQVAILTSGDAKAIAAEQESLKAQGKLSDDRLELIRAVAATEQELVANVAAERNRAIDAEQKRVDAIKAAADEIRSTNETTAARLEQIESDSAAAIASIRRRQAKGETVNQAEVTAITAKAANERQAIELANAEKVSQLATQIAEAEIAQNDRALEATQHAFDAENARRVQTSDSIEAFAAIEAGTIEANRKLREADLNQQAALLQKQIKAHGGLTESDKLAQQALAKSRLDLTNDVELKTRDLNEKTIQLKIANDERAASLEIAANNRVADNAATKAEQEQKRLDAATAASDAKLAGAKSIDEIQAISAERTQAVAASEAKIAGFLQTEHDLRVDSLDVEIKKLQAIEDSGQATAEQVEQLKALQTQKTNVEVSFELNKAKAASDAQANARTFSEATQDAIVSTVQDPLNAAVNGLFSKAFKGASSTVIQSIKDNFGKLMDEAIAFADQLNAARQQELDQESARNQERLTQIDDQLSQEEERVNKFEGILNENEDKSTGRSELANQQLDNESQHTEDLKKEKEALLEQEKTIAAEQEELAKASEERQKKIAAGQAALTAITSALATAQAFKAVATSSFDPISLAIGIASALAFVASMFAAITQAQDAFGEMGGYLNDDGTISYGKGGLVAGPSHAQGGVRGSGRFANVEVEGREFIVNKDATENNLGLLREINTFGAYRKFDHGGILNAPVPPPITNVINNGGGGYDILNELNDNFVNFANREVVVDLQELASKQDRLNKLIAKAKVGK
jgi:hypothetical protein